MAGLAVAVTRPPGRVAVTAGLSRGKGVGELAAAAGVSGCDGVAQISASGGVTAGALTVCWQPASNRITNKMG